MVNTLLGCAFLITDTLMQIDAMAVANYFIELAKRDQVELTLLGLVKRVYIAHGFSLALFDMSLLNPRFDKVEAWRYGPVIPSVYHTFKHHGNHPITEFATIAEWHTLDDEPTFITPTLEHDNAKDVCDMVWRRYQGYSGSDLVNITHRRGTPWAVCYQEGKNNEIPDEYTKFYYTKLKERILHDIATYERCEEAR